MMSLVAVLEAIKWLGFLVVNRIGREKIRVFSHQKKKKKKPTKNYEALKQIGFISQESNRKSREKGFRLREGLWGNGASRESKEIGLGFWANESMQRLVFSMGDQR